MKKYIGLVVMALTIAGCSGSSSPTEPKGVASLSGFVRSSISGGTIRVVDYSHFSSTAIINFNNGTYSFGTIFSAGPYDVYIDIPEKSEIHVEVHGGDASSPIMHTGANNFYFRS